LEYPRWLRSIQPPGGGASDPPPDPPPEPAGPDISAEWLEELRQLFSRDEDQELLRSLIEDGVQVTMYDRVYTIDQVFENGQWVEEEVNAYGLMSRDDILMIRTGDGASDACTLFHESVHTLQDDGMSQRDAERQAYIAEEWWAIDHGLTAANPDFRMRDEQGKEVVNEQAIQEWVDAHCPGITPPTEDRPAEQIIGLDPDGRVRFVNEDGVEDTRPPREGDVIPGHEPFGEPRDGVELKLELLLQPEEPVPVDGIEGHGVEGHGVSGPGVEGHGVQGHGIA
jgi:hypothetical protein